MDKGGLSKSLRYVQIDGTFYPAPGSGKAPQSGSPAPAGIGLKTIPQRIPKVIQLDKLASAMREQLGVPKDSFTAAEFVLELVESLAVVEFTLPTGG